MRPCRRETEAPGTRRRPVGRAGAAADPVTGRTRWRGSSGVAPTGLPDRRLHRPSPHRARARPEQPYVKSSSRQQVVPEAIAPPGPGYASSRRRSSLTCPSAERAPPVGSPRNVMRCAVSTSWVIIGGSSSEVHPSHVELPSVSRCASESENRPTTSTGVPGADPGRGGAAGKTRQVIAQRLGRGQRGPLRRRVRRQRHLLHRFIQQTPRHVPLHRSRILLLESSRVMFPKRALDRERSAVLDHNPTEPTGRTSRCRLQHAHHPLRKHPVQHGSHEVLEGTLRQLVVGGLVRERRAEQRMELPGKSSGADCPARIFRLEHEIGTTGCPTIA